MSKAAPDSLDSRGFGRLFLRARDGRQKKCPVGSDLFEPGIGFGVVLDHVQAELLGPAGAVRLREPAQSDFA